MAGVRPDNRASELRETGSRIQLKSIVQMNACCNLRCELSPRAVYFEPARGVWKLWRIYFRDCFISL